jgi:hypothetical protein
MKRVNVGVVVGSVLVLVGFFLAWVGIDLGHAAISVSGWEVARVAKEHGAIYYLVYLFPIGALAAGFFAFSKPRRAAVLAMLTGGGFLAWGLFEVMRLLWRTTFIGLWLTVLGALVLFVVGLATRAKR